MNAEIKVQIPRRHRRNTQVEQTLGRLHRIMPAITQPNEAQWRRIGEALMQGDPIMDRLVDAMAERGMRESREQFEQALDHGIESLSKPFPELSHFMEEVSSPPKWLDRSRLERGGALFRRCGKTAFDVGRNVALMGGYQASAFNRTLIITGALQKGATRRLAETEQWVLDCTRPDGMQTHGAGWQSTLRVRFIHALVRRSVPKREEWRMDEWGLPINQADMAATLYAALTVPILGSRLMGIPQTRRERDDAAHATRYIGWLIGVDEQWLADTEAEASNLLLQLLTSLTNPDETSAAMARPLADEPLGRYDGNLSWLRGNIERSRNLSISRAFLGSNAMQRLGLPDKVLPWYPALALPSNLCRQILTRLRPGGRKRLEIRGRAEQEAEISQLTRDRQAVVGQSVRATT